MIQLERAIYRYTSDLPPVAMEIEMNVLSYRVLLREEPEGGYTVIVPALPGCITYGSDLDEAIAMAKEAIELYIESVMAHDEEVPTEENTLEYMVTVPINA
jgi:predicted RNase H-like HicB family nuclease